MGDKQQVSSFHPIKCSTTPQNNLPMIPPTNTKILSIQQYEDIP